MPPIRSALAGALIALVATAAPAVAAPSACQSSHLRPAQDNLVQVEQAVLCLLNAERTQRGLPRLKSNSRLGDAAEKHSRDMVRRDFFSHTSPAGTSPMARVKSTGYLKGSRGGSVGENIAWGTGSYASPQETVEGWMDSAGHKANILHRGFEEIGIGIAIGAPGQGGDGATYTTNFGARL
jgi:uncharacterized protein YkwD